MQIRLWTERYRPMILGGDVHRPMATLVELHSEESGRQDLGNGFFGYVVTAPNSRQFVVEETSGGIVGSSLEEVRSDIATPECTLEEMQRQVESATKRGEYAELVSENEFWKMLRCNK